MLGESGNRFQVLLRINVHNSRNFSAILKVCARDSNQTMNLRRYNGDHEHTNRIERETFRGFHVHTATDRYQEAGWDAEAYAVLTDRYSNPFEALHCLMEDCNIIEPPGAQPSLFEEVAP